MVQFDNQYRQVKIKIVYYGPALGGKTTCLQHLHRIMDPQRRTRLYTLRTATDRTLFFDLLSLDVGRVRGYKLVLQLFTVPGQVQYDATRKTVLAGADGIVFVADSQPSQREANRESLANLTDNLRANGIDPATTPVVFQFNKRDLASAMSREAMEADLNREGKPVFPSVATDGQGVLEGFAAVTEATVLSVADRLGLSAQPESLKRLVRNVHGAFAGYLKSDGGAATEEPVVIRPSSGSGDTPEPDLVAEAVRANMAMTEMAGRLDRVTAELERRVRHLRFVNEFARLMTSAREPEDVTTGLVARLLAELGVGAGSLLVRQGDGEFVEVLRHGLSIDPALAIEDDGGSLAAIVTESRIPLLVRGDEIAEENPDLARWGAQLAQHGFVSALIVPLVAQDRVLGTVTAYADETRGSFEDAELELSTVLAAQAGVALSNARAWRDLEQLNSSLEDAVAKRTQELEDALVKTRELADELEERNRDLESANRRLREVEALKSDLLHRIAHEFNTPVTSIQTASRILARYDDVPRERVAKFVGIITEEAERLSELTASALQALVLGVPEAPVAGEPIPLAELLRGSVAACKGEIARRRLTVNVKVAPGLTEVVGDPEQVAAALAAIVKNAVEFNRDGGKVEIVVQLVRRGADTAVEIRVTDAGIGIAPEDLAHVQEAFWQGGDLMTSKPRGLGLGLAVARQVAENHGGHIEISSESGVGTSVAIFLPIAARN